MGLQNESKSIKIWTKKKLKKNCIFLGLHNESLAQIKIELLTTSEKNISIRYAILVYQDKWNIFWSQTQKTSEKYYLFLGLQNESKFVKIWTKNKLKKNCIFSGLHNESSAQIKIELLTTSEKSISIRYAILVYQDQWNIFWSQTQKTSEKYCLFLGLQNESKSVKIWTKNKLKKNCIFSSLHNESLAQIKIELLTTSEKSISIKYAILVYQDQWNIFWSQKHTRNKGYLPHCQHKDICIEWNW